MAKDQEKIVTLLAERTGMPESEVEQRLAEFKAQLKKVTQAGEEFQIKGFGTFKRQNGALHFETAERLKIEINQEYAGMEPIELVEAFKKSGAGVPVERADVSSDKVITNSRSETPESDEQMAAESLDDAEQPQGQDKPEPASVSEKTKKKPSKQTEKKAEKKDSPPPNKTKKTLPRYKKRRPQFSGAKWVAAAVVTIALLTSGWLLYKNNTFELGNDANANKTSFSSDTSQSGGGPVSAKKTSRPDSTHLKKTAKTAKKTNSVPKYGLHGAVNKKLKNAYTIVVHSFRLKSTVQNIADSLSQRGYRAVIFEGTPHAQPHWRVGIGQFKTREDAMQAVKKLPAHFRKDYFIHVINP